MTHPSEATLALYAGRDLSILARWRTERHLLRCERCRSGVEAFESLRRDVSAIDDLPGVPWNRLAAEMKANIRLGLAAGECVREPAPARLERGPLFGTRALVSYASIVALVAASVLLERPAPHPVSIRAEGSVLRMTGDGIELRQGGQALSLLHRGEPDSRWVTYSAQGAVRDRYVDSETGNVTFNTIYAQ